ncbi:MAG: nitrogenase component 1 [Spirochaetota bacterium]
MNLTYTNEDKRTFTATRNACRMCAPLGASLAFRGIEGCIPLIHGSQGCSTYIRRYIISHFREPMDIASSNFTEASAVFGGRVNLHTALDNVIHQYNPAAIGIASTCLSETIGDDVDMLIREYAKRGIDDAPPIIYASTPSYSGSHIDGYFKAIVCSIRALAQNSGQMKSINIIPGFVSSEDIRHLKEIFYDMKIDAVVFPDYSETMDGGTWEEYLKISAGGTPVSSIRSMGGASATLQLGGIGFENAADYLEKSCGVSGETMGLPIGIDETDRFFGLIKKITGCGIPEKYAKERGRLADSYIDGHKYVFGKRAVIIGDGDMAAGIAGLCAETGIVPVIIASGSGTLNSSMQLVSGSCKEKPAMLADTDFSRVLDLSRDLEPDIVIGPGKAYYVSRELGVPLVRVGFPVHDRIGGQRMLHIGYRGTLRIFDAIVNTLLEHKQNISAVGYSYQ